MKAEKWVVTSEEWATGFDIRITSPTRCWHLSGSKVSPNPMLFDDEDRKEMNELRDILVERFNGTY